MDGQQQQQLGSNYSIFGLHNTQATIYRSARFTLERVHNLYSTSHTHKIRIVNVKEERSCAVSRDNLILKESQANE